MDDPEDIGPVFAALRRVPERGLFTRDRAQRDVAEEIGYQLIVNPDWIRPHLAELVRAGVAAEMIFDWKCWLMDGAPDELIDELIERLPRRETDFDSLDLLLASRHAAAMDEVARTAATNPETAGRCRSQGFHLPTYGPAVPRFTIERRALRLAPGSPATGSPHAVGLPLTDVVSPGEEQITFHYASVTTAAFPALPAWTGQAHIVSIRSFAGWTMFARPDDSGRLSVLDVTFDDDDSLHELANKLDEAAAATQVSAALELLPFDDKLTYGNQHPMLTRSVIGTLGGPPMGLAPAPICLRCHRLMWHVGVVDTSAREYGGGFRSLFICENCRISATLATLYN